jgi:hypothetical protein
MQYFRKKSWIIGCLLVLILGGSLFASTATKAKDLTVNIYFPENTPYLTAKDVADAFNSASEIPVVTEITFMDEGQARSWYYFFESWMGDNFNIQPSVVYTITLRSKSK